MSVSPVRACKQVAAPALEPTSGWHVVQVAARPAWRRVAGTLTGPIGGHLWLDSNRGDSVEAATMRGASDVGRRSCKVARAKGTNTAGDADIVEAWRPDHANMQKPCFEAKASEGSRTGGGSLSACRCRWRAVHPQQPLAGGGCTVAGHRTGSRNHSHRGGNLRRQLGDVLCLRQGKRRNRRLGEQHARGCGGCRGCRGCRGCGAEAAEAAAEAAEAAARLRRLRLLHCWRGELAASARLEHFPLRLTRTVHDVQVMTRFEPGQPACLFAGAARVDARVGPCAWRVRAVAKPSKRGASR